jgi:hypothetical protein
MLNREEGKVNTSRLRLLFASLIVCAVAGALGQPGGSAAAAPVSSTITIPIAGTVNLPTASIALSGSAEIVSTVVLDALFVEPPRELVTIKLVGVSGVGLPSGTKYVARSQNTLLRILATSDAIDITFPFFPDTPDGALQARSLVAAFRLSFDLLTGTLIGGTGAFSTPRAAP